MTFESKQLLIRETEKYIRSVFASEATGHDELHIFRVRDKALAISRSEPQKADSLVIEMGALLHDLGDHKLFDRSPREMITEFLTAQSAPYDLIGRCCQIAEEISFKGNGVKTPLSTFEGAVIQDADRLDALGAVGIARTFAYGGSKGRPIYRPEIEPENHNNFESYKNSEAPTINHFYEKLLLLKDQMNTQTGKVMAEKAHNFMMEFLQRFYAEWDGRY